MLAPICTGTRNKECLSLGCDTKPLFSGRTPLDLYKGFIEAFADNFDYLFGEAQRETMLLLRHAAMRPVSHISFTCNSTKQAESSHCVG